MVNVTGSHAGSSSTGGIIIICIYVVWCGVTYVGNAIRVACLSMDKEAY